MKSLSNEQVSQFVTYATMLGLSGLDVMSIGRKMDNISKQALAQHHREHFKQLRLSGKLIWDHQHSTEFSIEIDGRWYWFSHDPYSYTEWKSIEVDPTNYKTLGAFRFHSFLYRMPELSDCARSVIILAINHIETKRWKIIP